MDEESKEALVVDSGWETRPILDAVKAAGASVRYVVTTHEHFNHTSTIGELAKEVGAKVAACRSSPVRHDKSADDGVELAIGKLSVRVTHTPGRTQDSICLYDGKEVFTGDTLLVGTTGSFDEGDGEAMYHSLFNVLLKLPSSTMVYSVHDYGDVPCRTLGGERLSNPFLSAKDFRSFVSVSD